MRIVLALLAATLAAPSWQGGSAASGQTSPDVPNLVAVLRNPSSDSMAKLSACRALGRMGARARQAVPAIILVLRDPDRDTRDGAITALYRIGPDSRPAIPMLEEVAASDPEPLLRSLATSAIEKIRGAAPPAPDSGQPARPPAPVSPRTPAAPPRAQAPTAQRGPAAGVRRQVPPPFTARPAGSGQMLSAEFRANRGRDALAQALDSLGGYFDDRPQVLRAIETVDGAGIQALFSTSLDRQPVRGFASAERGKVSLMFDRADRFGQSIAAAARPAAEPGRRAPRQVPLHPVRFSTGVIHLPDGWRITGEQSGVEASGPEGGIAFGYGLQAYTPQYAATLPLRPPMVISYGDPARAIQELGSMPNGLWRNVRILERAPSPGWDGPAEYLHYQADWLGQPSEIFALVLEKPVGPGTFLFYYSHAYTRIGEFERNFPVLMQIWQSWKTDDRVFQERLASAVRNMNECTRIIQGVIANRNEAMERANMAWDHYIRGTWPVEDTSTGRRGDFYQDINPTIRRLNEAEGYERWRPVPYEELNRSRYR